MKMAGSHRQLFEEELEVFKATRQRNQKIIGDLSTGVKSSHTVIDDFGNPTKIRFGGAGYKYSEGMLSRVKWDQFCHILANNTHIDDFHADLRKVTHENYIRTRGRDDYEEGMIIHFADSSWEKILFEFAESHYKEQVYESIVAEYKEAVDIGLPEQVIDFTEAFNFNDEIFLSLSDCRPGYFVFETVSGTFNLSLFEQVRPHIEHFFETSVRFELVAHNKAAIIQTES